MIVGDGQVSSPVKDHHLQMTSTFHHPIARIDDLIVTEIDDEVLVFDTRANHLHRLERDAADIWRSADGTRSVTDLAILTGLSQAEVEAILARLSAAGLLVTPWPATLPGSRLDRRRALKRAGIAAAVISVSAPTAARASSLCVTYPTCLAGGALGQTCCPAMPTTPVTICGYIPAQTRYDCVAPSGCDGTSVICG